MLCLAVPQDPKAALILREALSTRPGVAVAFLASSRATLEPECSTRCAAIPQLVSATRDNQSSPY